MDKAVGTLVCSVVAFVWGRSYMNEHQLVGFASVFGYQDSTYTVAEAALVLGCLGFLTGLALLVAALVRLSVANTSGPVSSALGASLPGTSFSSSPRIRGALKGCRECGRMVSVEALACPGCGVPNPGSPASDHEFAPRLSALAAPPAVMPVDPIAATSAGATRARYEPPPVPNDVGRVARLAIVPIAVLALVIGGVIAYRSGTKRNGGSYAGEHQENFTAISSTAQSPGQAVLSQPSLAQTTPLEAPEEQPAPQEYINRAEQKIQARDFMGAKRDLVEAIQRYPKDALVANQFAWLLATSPDATVRDGNTAAFNAKLACDLSQWIEPNYLDTYAAAMAEMRNFDEASRWETRALTFPNFAQGASGDSARARLHLYETHQAYHQQ